MNHDAALVVFSGGQDSTTCLFWAKKRFRKVYALSFLYGQKHEREVELARVIAEKAEVDFHVMDVSFVYKIHCFLFGHAIVQLVIGQATDFHDEWKLCRFDKMNKGIKACRVGSFVHRAVFLLCFTDINQSGDDCFFTDVFLLVEVNGAHNTAIANVH